MRTGSSRAQRDSAGEAGDPKGEALTPNNPVRPTIYKRGKASRIQYDKVNSRAGSTQNYGSLAQLVEQLAFNQLVTGSNPVRPTIYVICQVVAWSLVRLIRRERIRAPQQGGGGA
jgi:hypothetical protein